MDAVEFLKNCQRICNRNSNCCEECLLSKNGACALTKGNIENIVLIVEQWAKFHPIETRMSEFLSYYPDAPLSKLDNLPLANPCHFDPELCERSKDFDCGRYKDCSECRKRYWLKAIN